MKVSEINMYPFKNPMLPTKERIDDLLGRLTLSEKIGLMPTTQQEIERLNINEFIIGGEAAHGVAWLGKATCFPQPIGMASSWNPNLLFEIGTAISDEAWVYYKRLNKKQGLTLWAPTVDMERDPRWGRTEEGYGEDPYLTGVMARALVDGMQGDHPFYKKTVSTIKHYIGNNNEIDRLTSSSNIDNRNKFEYYVKPFQYVIQNNGAYSIMPAYNSVNGLPCIIDPELNTLVKGKWGLDGFIVSDAGDMKMTVDFHKYCSTYAESVAFTIKSGVDSINDEVDLVIESITEALHQDLLTESDIDRALRNTLKGRFQLGQFDPENLNPFESITEDVLCCDSHNELSLKAAQESIVLLKNLNNTLPINKSIKKLAVIGPLSDVLHRDWYSGEFPYMITPLEGIKNKLQEAEVQHKSGCDRIAIRSKSSGKYLMVDESAGGIIKAIGEEIDESTVFELTDWGWGKCTIQSMLNGMYVSLTNTGLAANADKPWGWFVREVFNFISNNENTNIITWNNKIVEIADNLSGELLVTDYENQNENFEIINITNGIKEAEELAEKSDAVVVFVGNYPLINGKEDQDRPDINLVKKQEELIQSLYKKNSNLIVFIIGSYPFSICELDDLVPAIIYTSHGSQELGNAISNVLFGDYSPAGRLTMTWYRNVEQLPDIKNYDIIQNKSTYLYFTGEPLYVFGHGLTYSTFNYENININLDKDLIRITCEITNIGEVASDEVVQVYVTTLNSRVKRPLKELKAFKRINVEPNEKKNISFTIPVEELSFWDVTRERYCVETGLYRFMIGASSKDIKLTKILEVIGEEIPKRDLTQCIKAENYDNQSNVLLKKNVNGEQYVYAVKEDAWLMFMDVDLTNLNEIELELLSTDCIGSLEIRGDSPYGEILGKISIEPSLQWQITNVKITNYHNFENIYFTMNNQLSLKWFRFKNSGCEKKSIDF